MKFGISKSINLKKINIFTCEGKTYAIKNIIAGNINNEISY
ncbi:MAG: hypothetical protein RR891_10500 [Clostridium sp.]